MEIQASEGVVFLLNLLLTFCIYTLPFIIIRFAIRKKPYSAAQAKRMVIIYGIAAWLAMSVVMYASGGSVAGGGVLLWSFINYKVLVSNSNSKDAPTEPKNLPTEAERIAEAEAQTQRLYNEFCDTYTHFSDGQLIVIAKSNDASDVCIKAAKHILETRGIYLTDNAAAVKTHRSGSRSAWESIGAFLENPPKKLKPIVIVSLLVIVVAALIVGSNNPAGGNSTSPTKAVTPTPAPASAYNGEIFVVPSYESLCPLTVSVQGNQAYYVFLDYLYAPSYSTVDRHLEGAWNSVREELARINEEYGVNSSIKSDLAFYISPGSTVEIDVPIGVYRLYYATGETWYGKALLFGEDTATYTSDDLLEFYADDYYYNGVTLELWRQSGGNFDTKSISYDDFPS